MIIPPEKRLVAALVASEWENQDTVLKPHALPMVCRLPGLYQHSFNNRIDVHSVKSYRRLPR